MKNKAIKLKCLADYIVALKSERLAVVPKKFTSDKLKEKYMVHENGKRS